MYCLNCDLLVETEKTTIYDKEEAERVLHYLEGASVDVDGDFDVEEVGKTIDGEYREWDVMMFTESCANCGDYLRVETFKV